MAKIGKIGWSKMQTQNGMSRWQDVPWKGSFPRKWKDAERALAGCVFVAILLVSCGGNLDSISRIESQEEERDAAASNQCVEQPWALAFGFSIDANAVISHASMDFLPATHVQLTRSVSTVTQGAPGSDRLLSASLISASGDVLSQALFDDPRLTSDYAKRGTSYDMLSLQLVPGAVRLVIRSWQTAAVLLDLDLHGDIQLLCLNQPCLDLCSNPDAGTPPPIDGSQDTPSAVDGSGTE
jgi:hypothetical protein